MNAAPVPATHREVHLAARPEGPLTTDHFRLVEAPVPVAGPRRILVRNRLMGVTAVMRTLMAGNGELPMPGYAPGAVLSGPAVGEVISAPEGSLKRGDLVEHNAGWREYAVLGEDEAQRLDLEALPDPVAHLSQGFVAWLAVVRGAEIRAGDTVLVTGAAGGVGTMAGQFARLHGAARVIGSTSSRQKADRLTDRLGYDAAVIRSAGPIDDQLRALAPDGLDAVIDLVGGDQLRAALAQARQGARIALVGSLASQTAGSATAPVVIDTAHVLNQGITLRGIAGHAHLDALGQWTEEFGRGLRAGTLTVPHTLVHGIDRAPQALCDLLAGRHIGAVLIEL
ncbi:NADP-dependent oxidoreductase [Streptomyces uncialis]|uniref:MDR family NADP-dependent oxidoreductase n=1 Tax=Streptomyces uncialis TaxID=1048205 RepID=UPI002E31AF6B|nr:NADP-dependent oxidoreductase [Streptomyces uncialis]